MSEDTCPKCGGAMRQTGKHTGGGTDWREYACDACGHTQSEDRGHALWAVLSEANERVEAARALKAGAAAVFVEGLPERGVPAGTRVTVLSVDVGAGEASVEADAPGGRARMTVPANRLRPA